MKVVILAGGLGTRISEESDHKPKPMIEVGGKPLLWHIMKHYSHYGFNEFIVCAGYKAEVIKEYFHHYYLYNADTTFNLEKNSVHHHASTAEPWKVTVVDTGLNTMTGGRVKKVQKYIGDGPFLLTYGDGVSDVDIHASIRDHIAEGRVVTLTAIQTAGRFGSVEIGEGNKILTFKEKIQGDGAWINGGFMVCEPSIFEYINGDEMLERGALERIANAGKLGAYKHIGFWQPMDTLRDKNELEKLWNSNPPWRIW